jgi:trimethylamine:corrinoid methyltransferase-like protein
LEVVVARSVAAVHSLFHKPIEPMKIPQTTQNLAEITTHTNNTTFSLLSQTPARMEDSRSAYKILVEKPERKGPLGRPRRRLEGKNKMDI